MAVANSSDGTGGSSGPGRRGRRRAVALRYEPGSNASPQVVASGEDLLAEAICRIAKEKGVPIREDAALAGALGSLKVGQAIPPELYRAVAEVLAFLWRVESKRSSG